MCFIRCCGLYSIKIKSYFEIKLLINSNIYMYSIISGAETLTWAKLSQILLLYVLVTNSNWHEEPIKLQGTSTAKPLIHKY